MDSKRIFEEAKTLHAKVEQTKKFYDNLSDEIVSYCSIQYDRLPIQKNAKLSVQERSAEKLDQASKSLQRHIDRYLTHKATCIELLMNLDCLNADILYMRYLEGNSVSQISEHFNYSERQIYTICDKSFQKLDSMKQ